MHFWAYLLCIATGVSAIAFRETWARDATEFFSSGAPGEYGGVRAVVWVYLVGGVFFLLFGVWGLLRLN